MKIRFGQLFNCCGIILLSLNIAGPSYAASLECELMKEDIISQTKALREDPFEKDYELCMKNASAAIDKIGCKQRHDAAANGHQAGEVLNKAVGGSSPQDRINAMTKEYKEKCE